MGYPQIANNAWGNLASGIGIADVTIPLSTGQGARFPATSNGDSFYITLVDVTGALEIIHIIDRTGDILTAAAVEGRGADGTTPRIWPSGTALELRLVRRYFNTDLPLRYASRDGAVPMLGNLDMDDLYTVANLKAPTNPNDAATKKYVDDLVAKAMPIGAIIMWKSATIPAGWQICDGTGDTVDLRDKFVVGAGTGYTVLATGGQATVTLSLAQIPSHQHGGSTDVAGYHSHGGGQTTANGAHNHYSGISRNVAIYGGGGPQDDIGENMTANPIFTSTEGDHVHGIAGDGSHQHSIVTDFRGGGGAHENRPPYTALYYIAKTF